MPPVSLAVCRSGAPVVILTPAGAVILVLLVLLTTVCAVLLPFCAWCCVCVDLGKEILKDLVHINIVLVIAGSVVSVHQTIV